MTRREALRRLGAGSALLCCRPGALWAAASQPSTAVDFEVPAGACDCHTHVFGDPRRFPFAAARVYTPERASVEELQALHRALRTERTVVVQPSVYGTDNACTLEAVRRLGPSARGIAVIDGGTSDAALDAMHRVGVRGIRLNLATGRQVDPAESRRRFAAAARRIEGRGWHLQIYTQLPVIAALADLIGASAIPVVFDHFGGAQAALGSGQPGFAELLGLVRAGRAYVKLSGAYRASALGPDYPDVAPLAQALVEANPERMVWASDWPHPDSSPPAGRPLSEITPLYRVDDAHLFNLFAAWVPEAARRRAILVDNPARLYGF
jgi:predicted TIM-barrel fold metal-dependent hydrolase